jgi:hypothetical protein
MILSTTNPTLCAGGNHFAVDVTIGGKTRRVHFGRDELTSPLDIDEIRNMLLGLLKLEWRSSGENPVAFRNAINGKSWDL